MSDYSLSKKRFWRAEEWSPNGSGNRGYKFSSFVKGVLPDTNECAFLDRRRALPESLWVAPNNLDWSSKLTQVDSVEEIGLDNFSKESLSKVRRVFGEQSIGSNKKSLTGLINNKPFIFGVLGLKNLVVNPPQIDELELFNNPQERNTLLAKKYLQLLNDGNSWSKVQALGEGSMVNRVDTRVNNDIERIIKTAQSNKIDTLLALLIYFRGDNYNVIKEDIESIRCRGKFSEKEVLEAMQNDRDYSQNKGLGLTKAEIILSMQHILGKPFNKDTILDVKHLGLFLLHQYN